MSYFDPYILAKMRKMSYFDPYFSSKLGKMYSFDPLFDPCSVSSRRAVRSIPIQNLTEYPPPPPPGSRSCFSSFIEVIQIILVTFSIRKTGLFSILPSLNMAEQSTMCQSTSVAYTNIKNDTIKRKMSSQVIVMFRFALGMIGFDVNTQHAILCVLNR